MPKMKLLRVAPVNRRTKANDAVDGVERNDKSPQIWRARPMSEEENNADRGKRTGVFSISRRNDLAVAALTFCCGMQRRCAGNMAKSRYEARPYREPST